MTIAKAHMWRIVHPMIVQMPQ